MHVIQEKYQKHFHPYLVLKQRKLYSIIFIPLLIPVLLTLLYARTRPPKNLSASLRLKYFEMWFTFHKMWKLVAFFNLRFYWELVLKTLVIIAEDVSKGACDIYAESNGICVWCSNWEVVVIWYFVANDNCLIRRTWNCFQKSVIINNSASNVWIQNRLNLARRVFSYVKGKNQGHTQHVEVLYCWGLFSLSMLTKWLEVALVSGQLYAENAYLWPRAETVYMLVI